VEDQVNQAEARFTEVCSAMSKYVTSRRLPG